SLESSSRAGYGTGWLIDSHIRGAADALSGKLKSAGYRYINIDAGWNATFGWVFHTDVNGIPDPEPTRFPDGIAPLASYVHGKGDGTTADNVPDIAAWSKAIDHSGRRMWLTASAWPVPRPAGPALGPYANGVRVDTDVECYCNTVATWDNTVKARWADVPGWQGVFGRGFRPDL